MKLADLGFSHTTLELLLSLSKYLFFDILEFNKNNKLIYCYVSHLFLSFLIWKNSCFARILVWSQLHTKIHFEYIFENHKDWKFQFHLVIDEINITWGMEVLNQELFYCATPLLIFSPYIITFRMLKNETILSTVTTCWSGGLEYSVLTPTGNECIFWMKYDI